MKIDFRTGFYVGAALAIALGLFLLRLWDPGRQVRLHSEHLLVAIEKKEWATVSDILDPRYADQWEHDRATVITRMRQILPYARNLRIHSREVIVRAADGEGEWRARITLEAEPNEVSAYLLARVNPLEAPFVLSWRRASRKPWDWKLMRVENAALDLPNDRMF